MGMVAPDVEHIAFGQFAAGDPSGRLGRVISNPSPNAPAINVTVNVQGMVTADKVEMGEFIADVIQHRARINGLTPAVGV